MAPQRIWRTVLTLALLLLQLHTTFASALPQSRKRLFTPNEVHLPRAYNASLYTSNARRMAAGLPPSKPKRMFSPTRAGIAARAPSQTPTPSVAFRSGQHQSHWFGWKSSSLATGILAIWKFATQTLVQFWVIFTRLSIHRTPQLFGPTLWLMDNTHSFHLL